MTRRSRTALVTLAIVLLLTSLSAHAAQPEPELVELFPQRASVQAPAGQGVRLELPTELFLQCQADVSDLRLLDSDGQQVPYAVERAPAEHAKPLPGDELVIEIPRIAEVDRRRIDRVNGPPLYRERYRLVLPDTASSGRQWELQLVTSLPVFTRRARIEAADETGDEDRASDAASPTEVSIFRLRNRRQEQLHLPLPEPAAAVVEIELEGEGDGFLEPGFELRSRHSAEAPPMTEITLRELERRAEEGRTVLEFERPPGLAPVALSVVTTTETFRRPVEIRDSGTRKAGAGAESSRETPVVARGVVSSALPTGAPEAGRTKTDPRRIELPALRWRGDRLRITIENGDSPSLSELRWVAHQAIPALLFTQPEGGATLYFGGGRAPAPRYDLETLWTDGAGGRSSFEAATLGAVESNPAFTAPSFAAAHRSQLLRWLLWAILGLAVVALVVLTFKVARQETPAG